MEYDHYADANEEKGGGGLVVANNEANKTQQPLLNHHNNATTPAAGEAKMALTEDETKVKFTNANHERFPAEPPSRNGEAKVEIENVQVAFAGMGKEELMKFANDPFWIRLRWFLLILFWLVWLAMLVGAIVIIVFAKKCDPLPTVDWWQKNGIYHILTPSFQDSNGDGVGDLPGVESRSSYLKELGIGTVLLSSIYAELMSSIAHNVNDTTSSPVFHPQIGTMENFNSLVEKFNSDDIKIVIDFVPSYTTTSAQAFNRSRSGDPEYEDYYIWRDGQSSSIPPNKKVDKNGKPLWTFDQERNQFYLHDSASRPCVNLQSSMARKDMQATMKFWLDKGVSGFMIDGIDKFACQEHDDEAEQEEFEWMPDVMDVLQECRQVLTDYEQEHGGYRILILDNVPNINTTIQVSGNATERLVDLALTSEFSTTLKENVSGSQVTEKLTEMLTRLPDFIWPAWTLGNEDDERISSRIDPDLIDGLHMITTLLRGTPVSYYGEEIGMVDVKLHESNELFTKLYTPSWRSPMQWNDSINFGFTSNDEIKFPENGTFRNITVKGELSAPQSHLKVYKHLMKLRKEPAVQLGSLTFLNLTSQVVSFSRVKKGSPGYLVLVNFDRNATADLSLNLIPELGPQYGISIANNVRYKIPPEGTVELVTAKLAEANRFKLKSKMKLDKLTLNPMEGIVLKFVPTIQN